METILQFRKTLAEFFQRPPPPPTLPNSPIDPQNQPPDLAVPIEQPLRPLPLPNAQQQQQHNNFDFPTLVLAFCLTGAMEIAIQNHTVNPRIFHLLCLMVVFAFAPIFVAKYIAPQQPDAARKLDSVGVFSGVTAFFLAVTTSFPLCLVIVSWIIYGLSLLAILICNCPQGPLFPI